MSQKNFFSIEKFSPFYSWFAYFDTEDFLADSLFERQKISVRYEQEYHNPVNHYRMFICRVPMMQIGRFLKAVGQLPNKMNLLGFTDYEDFCRDYLDESEQWINRQLISA